jgi:hypothetical protein
MKRTLKLLIWLYLILLIIEGSLRKWLLPSMSDPLLIVRDPVVLVIYMVALVSGVFPFNRFIVAIVALAGLSTLFYVLGGHSNVLVLGYGLRIDFFHLPLIWIMGSVLDRRDVERIGAFLLLTAIPMTLIMVQQFRSPMNAFINRGVGEDEVGQIFGADGRIRPPGLFAFITGPQSFFPLCAAFFFDEISGAKRLPWFLLIASGLAIAVALPVSISRTVMLGTGLVAVAFLISLPFLSTRVASLARPLFLLLLVGAGLSQLPVFRESASVFMMRWNSAAEGNDGAAWAGVMDRTVNGFTNPYYFIKIAPFFGHGIGSGSNVGARLMSGDVGFMLAEEEWGKVLLELGPIVGVGFIVFRIVLTFWLGIVAWRALRENRNALPLLILTATALVVLQGQWAPPTVLGFAVVGAGLVLGALNVAPSGPSANPVEPTVRPVPRPRGSSDRRLPQVLRPARK